jgi:hypothetical protein
LNRLLAPAQSFQKTGSEQVEIFPTKIPENAGKQESIIDPEAGKPVTWLPQCSMTAFVSSGKKFDSALVPSLGNQYNMT